MNIDTAIEQLETSLHNEAAAFRSACAMGDVTLSIIHINTCVSLYDRLDKMINPTEACKIWSQAFSENFLPKESASEVR